MNIKPLAPLTKLLIILLKVSMGLLVIALLVDCYSWYEYSQMDPSIDASDIFLSSDAFVLGTGVLQLVLAIFLGVTFLRWIYRINQNLHALSAESMKFTPGWAVGWYFIPIASLVKPYQAMKEIWTVAHRGESSRSKILGVWWFFWLMTGVLDRLSMKSSMLADSAKSYMISARWDAASDGMHIILNAIALMLIAEIAKAYQKNDFESGAATMGAQSLMMGNSEVDHGPTSVS